MKHETVLKGFDLLRQIEAIAKTKDYLEKTSRINCYVRNKGDQIGIQLNNSDEDVQVDIQSVNSAPDDLKEQLTEETRRFIQRCKRHCDQIEKRLKEELEDL